MKPPDADTSALIHELMLDKNRIVTVDQMVSEAVGPIAEGDMLINFDTVLLHLDQTREFWFDQLLLRWADLGRALSSEGGHRAFHRFVFIPTPTDLRCLPSLIRAKHAAFIQLALHIQLWFGAVCHIVPMPQSRLMELSSQWSSYMKDARVMFRAPNYYLENFSEFEVLRHRSVTNPRIERMARELRRRTVATLSYTSEHFEKRRIRTAAWKNIRAVMAALYPRCVAPLCRSRGVTHVDHIFQIGKNANSMNGRANSCLLNLRQFCDTCNLTRPKTGSDYDPYSRYFKEVVPERYRTPDVRRIIDEPPPWLGGSFDAPWRVRLETLF